MNTGDETQAVNAGVDDGLLDPSLQEGGEIIFDSELLLCFITPNEQNEQRQSEVPVRFKIIKREGDEGVEMVRVELSSDSDLFMYYESKFTEAEFEALQEQQDLKISFDKFPDTLTEILSTIGNKSSEFSIEFTTKDDETAGTLKFVQQLKFKNVEIFSLEFTEPKDDFVRNQIQYRFNALQADLKAARSDLSDLCAMLKIKNPSVLKQMKPSRK